MRRLCVIAFALRLFAVGAPDAHGERVRAARSLFAEGNIERALAEAVALNRNMPDDLDTYALVVNAALALGKIGQAEKAAQWMLNLRPEDIRSLIAGASVREAIQDDEGAVQMLSDALVRTSRTDVETRIDIGSRLIRITRRLGRVDEARRLMDQVNRLRRELEKKR